MVPQKMLASRLLSILMTLQTRGRTSARELAAMFEVSERTIHRDIDQLSAAGIPVYAERGRSGGFSLLGGYRTKLTGLSQSEAEALFLAGLPGPARDLGLSEKLTTAKLKLLAALPAELQPERIAQRFHLDPTAWFGAADIIDSLQPIARAVWTGRWLKLQYRNAGQYYGRRLGPLGLVLKAGVWYLVAQSGKAVRTYRVAHMHDVEIVEEAFARPKDFDLAAYWEKASRRYEEGVYRCEANIRIAAPGLARLAPLGSHVAEMAARTAGRPDRHGRVRCTIPIESIESGVRELARLGDDVEVIGPAQLRETFIAMVYGMLKRHRADRSRRPARPLHKPAPLRRAG
jgi:predicted DNA-binding transcriptional regulator YafY